MILAAAVDDRMGLAFNHRRQSRDGVLRRALIKEAAGAPIWMSAYSLRQFKDDEAESADLRACDNFFLRRQRVNFVLPKPFPLRPQPKERKKLFSFAGTEATPPTYTLISTFPAAGFLSKAKTLPEILMKK